ncbi:LOW QUALITY PROTEIN: RNA-binding KH domain-containing protein RCF3-like [Typha latifolia]|uniref:LOW QUALITY PROTEIN: RNA-binding KH domain-containing protein RCF3-like n=1 Tax=Typha latifolia TaxID=4733 RepID=UPI003C2EF4A6
MDRSRSKRNYHFEPDSTSPSPPPRSKARYDGGHRRPNHHRRGGDRRLQPPPPPPLPPPPPPPPLPSSSSASGAAPASPLAVTTFFRVLCPNVKSGAVIGKSMSVIKTIRQDTGAWITVHPLVPGDEEYIIETADDRRREPDGRPPLFSPAQDALLLIHRRIVDAEFDDDDEDGYGGDGGWGGGGGGGERDRGRVTTRLVVPRLHVGCLLGKGGKIIEQMRMETKTHIRILPRDQYTPRCVSTSEEVVQIVGEGNCVKKAVAIISARLKESLHRDRGNFRGRIHSPEHYFPPEDEFLNNTQHQSAVEESDLGSRSSIGPNRIRNNYGPEPSGYAFDSDGNAINDRSQSFSYDDMVFRILCPNNKVEGIMGATDGILKILQADVGVDVRVGDPVAGSDEQIIIITSDEGPDDELFPAQEALLHIQTHIVDLGPDKDNIITTRLLVPASEIACLEGRDGLLSDIQRLTSANVQILPKENLPLCAMEADELVQIVGEIRAARNALVQVTAKLRSHLYRDLSVANDSLQPFCATSDHAGLIAGHESTPPLKGSSCEAYQGNDPPMAINQHKQNAATAWHSKDTGGSASGSFEQEESNFNDETKQNSLKRFSVPLVTRSTLEVVIPKSAVPSLIMRSGSKLAQISEMSGATVTLIEDRPELSEKIVQISGSPDQAERAQSLLQGFILSTLDDVPSS